MAGWIDFAQLVRTANNVRAQINAFPCAQCVRLTAKASLTVLVCAALILEIGHLALRLTAHLQIAWVTKVAIGTDTRRAMIIGHTKCIRTALYL